MAYLPFIIRTNSYNSHAKYTYQRSHRDSAHIIMYHVMYMLGTHASIWIVEQPKSSYDVVRWIAIVSFLDSNYVIIQLNVQEEII